MLIAEELEVDLKQVRLETCSAQRKAVRQSLARSASHRQLECDTRCVAAAAPGRCDREDHARVGGGKALECRSRFLPGAKRRGRHAPTGRRLKYGELAADAARMPVPETVVLAASLATRRSLPTRALDLKAPAATI